MSQAASRSTGGTSALSVGGSAGRPSSTVDPSWCIAPAFDAIASPSAQSCQTDAADAVIHSIRERVTFSALAIAFDRTTTMQQPLTSGGESKWDGVGDAIRLLTNHEPAGFLSGISWVASPVADGPDPLTNCDERNLQVHTNWPQSASTINNSEIIGALNPAQTTLDGRPGDVALAATASMRSTGSGLLAALREARRMATQDKSHVVTPVVVLISDGMPNGCGDWDDIDQLSVVLTEMNPPASNGFAPIHVIQLGADFDLTPLAVAGGTDRPHVISQGPIGPQLAHAIRGILYPPSKDCRIALDLRWRDPSLEPPSRFALRIESPYTTSATAPPFLASADGCDNSPSGGFWVRELEPMNYVVELCPCTCGARQTFRFLQVLGFCE